MVLEEKIEKSVKIIVSNDTAYASQAKLATHFYFPQPTHTALLTKHVKKVLIEKTQYIHQNLKPMSCYLSHSPFFLHSNIILIPMVWFIVIYPLLNHMNLFKRLIINLLIVGFINFAMAIMCKNAYPSIENLWYLLLYILCILGERKLNQKLSELDSEFDPKFE